MFLFRHIGDPNIYCSTCGVAASNKFQQELQETNNQTDKNLKDAGKRRVKNTADGHCLPRAIFNGCKRKDLLFQFVTYKQLLKESINSILTSWDNYKNFAEEQTKADATRHLKLFLEQKAYSLPSLTLDLVIYALANVTSTNIVVYYSGMKRHVFSPVNGYPIAEIELVFANGHYDLVITVDSDALFSSKKNVSENQIAISDSPCKLNSSTAVKKEFVKVEGRNLFLNRNEDDFDFTHKVQSVADLHEENTPVCEDDHVLTPITSQSPVEENVDELEVSILSPQSVEENVAVELEDDVSVNSDDDFEHPPQNVIGKSVVAFRGGKRYIDPSVFDDVEVAKVDVVPDDIDDLTVYEVPIKSNLGNCKGLRPWCVAQSSKSAAFTDGPRLLMNCKGSSLCSNMQCPNIADFGVNRADFTNEGKCCICGKKGDFVKCTARLIIEKNTKKGIATVKHHGVHTCTVAKKGRPDKDELMRQIQSNPRQTRESMVRQSIAQFVEAGDISGAVDRAACLTDVRYIDNLKAQEKRERRPDGHSFHAVEVLREKLVTQDKYLIFDLSDGSDGGVPYVLKSSKTKVGLLKKLDMNGSHRLSQQTVHLDVLHSHTKGWKTYTLSYYDEILKMMVKLVSMDTPHEDKTCCEIFFRKINDMIQVYVGDEEGVPSTYVFNPYHLKDDEHGGNKLGMSAVFGEVFVVDRTSSCEFHYLQAVRNHARYINKVNRDQYMDLCTKLKDSLSQEVYNNNYYLLRELISQQVPGNRKPLEDALAWWVRCKARWVQCFRASTHNIPLSSLAECAQASMVADGGKNLSLIDSVVAANVDSVRLDAAMQNRRIGERAQGSGPSAEDLRIRNERRQVERGQSFLDSISTINQQNRISNQSTASIFDSSRTHRPDKPAQKRNSTGDHPSIKSKRRRSLTSGFFNTILNRYHKTVAKCRALSMEKLSDGSFVVKIEESGKIQKVEVGLEIYCSCTKSHRADRRTCIHIVWCFNKLCSVDLSSDMMAQVSLEEFELQSLTLALPSTIPPLLAVCQQSNARVFNDLIKNHPKFDIINDWYVGIKRSQKPCRCGGCLVVGIIKCGDLHLFTKGILYLPKQNKVVETTMRFCVKRSCVQNITSSFTNIRPMLETQLKRQPASQLTVDQQGRLQVEGFTVSGLPPLNLN